VNGFYAPLMQFLDRAVRERFLRDEHRAIAVVESDPGRCGGSMSGVRRACRSGSRTMRPDDADGLAAGAEVAGGLATTGHHCESRAGFYRRRAATRCWFLVAEVFGEVSAETSAATAVSTAVCGPPCRDREVGGSSPLAPTIFPPPTKTFR
jgi:hypothetical protein